MSKKLKPSKKQLVDKQLADNKFLTSMRTNPTGSAILAINKILRSENIDLITLAENLAEQQVKMSSDDTYHTETMLINQSQALQALFYHAVETSIDCQMVNQIQIFADIAFKANNACRKTLLALNHIKNPAANTLFIKQQNNAVNQQVNNGVTEPQVLKNSEKILTNELLSAA